MAPQNLADHGSFPQVKKPLRVIVLIVLYPFVIAGLIWFVLESFPGAPFEDAALVIVTVFGNVLMTGLLIYHRHKTRDRWIRAEAVKWLRQRSRSGAQHGRGRALLWAPSVIALTVFLFCPEALSIASHLFGRQPVGGHELKVPLTWIVARNTNSYLWVVAGKGIGRVGPFRYWRGEEPVSEITFNFYGPGGADLPKWMKVTVLSTRTVHVGGEALTCWDFNYSYRKPVDPGLAEIDCYGPTTKFQAFFSGSRNYAGEFYRMLEPASPLP
jgi:hypothetical protein